jgi:perosamine synthetase
MEKTSYPLNEPYLKWKEKEYVLDVLDSGWLSVKGKHTKIFEEKFAQMVGLKYALAVQSGTAALHTALLSLGIGKNDKVLVPNFTCAGCVTSVIQCGATPVILDVEKETFGLDINNVKEFLKQEKPKAIMIIHVYGFPARDIKEIAELCRKEKILLLEDCCEAHGAQVGDRRTGTFGDIAVFSVRSEKMIGVGEGGLILANDKELIDNAFYWATRASPHRGYEHAYWKMYSYSGIGMNYLMPHLLGAVGRAQIENFDEILSRKRRVGEEYQSIFENIDGIKVQKKIDGNNPSYWLNMILLEDKSKEEVRKIGEKLIEKGLIIRPPFWPLGDQDIFREFAFGSQKIGNLLFEKGIILPSSVFLSDDGCKRVKEVTEILFDVLKAYK